MPQILKIVLIQNQKLNYFPNNKNIFVIKHMQQADEFEVQKTIMILKSKNKFTNLTTSTMYY